MVSKSSSGLIHILYVYACVRVFKLKVHGPDLTEEMIDIGQLQKSKYEDYKKYAFK